jgi:predicted nuclease of predicted toxin-antitoxin system
MRLLFDQSLSFKPRHLLADIFPESSPVLAVGLAEADDRAVWEFAKANGFTLVSQDSDFAEMAALLGPPPKLVWLRSGNQPTSVVEAIFRKHAGAITAFDADLGAASLEIY